MTFDERLRTLLRNRRRRLLDSSASRRSAVLVPLLCDDDGYRLLYTLRSEDLPTHRGDVAFPGGTSTAAESPETTALREAEEEIGLAPGRVDVLGFLDDIYTLGTTFHITPVVGLVRGPVQLVPAPGEVRDIFTLALKELIAGDGHRGRRQGGRSAIHAAPHEIWGTTLSITENFLECAGPPWPGRAQNSTTIPS